MLFLVKGEFTCENSEAGSNRPIEKKRLGESKRVAPLETSQLRRQGERFTQSQEIVRLVRGADKGAGNSAHATGEADGLFPFFVHLQPDIHRTGLHVALQLGVLRFDDVEVAELVEPQYAQFPQAIVVHLAFIQQNFPADHFIAGGGVTGKFDAAHEKLLLLIELHRQIYDFLHIIDLRHRLGYEINVAIFPV